MRTQFSLVRFLKPSNLHRRALVLAATSQQYQLKGRKKHKIMKNYLKGNKLRNLAEEE